MMEVSPTLVFKQRAKSVPGDLRISWRLSMTLLTLHYCRGKRASFVKLHLLNGALRSGRARTRLLRVLNGDLGITTCTIRVEPAFSRNLDLVVGKGLANWSVASSRLSIELTSLGIDVAKALDAKDSLFTEEREFLASTGKRVTEQVIKNMVNAGRGQLL